MATAEANLSTRGKVTMQAFASSDDELLAAAEIRQEDIVLALAWLQLYAPELARMAEASVYEREQVTLALMAGLAAGGTRYVYLSRRGVYFDLRTRRPVPPSEVRRLLDRGLDRAGREARMRTMALRSRSLDLPG